VKFPGTAKLNLNKNESTREEAQINKSILNTIQDGVVDLKNLTDFTKKEFESKLNISHLFSWSISFNVLDMSLKNNLLEDRKRVIKFKKVMYLVKLIKYTIIKRFYQKNPLIKFLQKTITKIVQLYGLMVKKFLNLRTLSNDVYALKVDY
jgi:hypothetical protein